MILTASLAPLLTVTDDYDPEHPDEAFHATVTIGDTVVWEYHAGWTRGELAGFREDATERFGRELAAVLS